MRSSICWPMSSRGLFRRNNREIAANILSTSVLICLFCPSAQRKNSADSCSSNARGNSSPFSPADHRRPTLQLFSWCRRTRVIGRSTSAHANALWAHASAAVLTAAVLTTAASGLPFTPDTSEQLPSVLNRPAINPPMAENNSQGSIR